MNLAQIRTRVFQQTDWAPETSPEARERVRGHINAAYRDLVLDAPFLFFDDELQVTAEPDVPSKSVSDTVQMSGDNDLASSTDDPWTFETTYTKTAADAAPTTYTATWKTDRSWDAREIYFELTDGTLIRNRIRTIWYDSSDDKWKFTVETPWNWPTHGTGPFKFKVFTETYAFPDDLIQMKSMRIWNATQHWPIDIVGQDLAEDLILAGPQSSIAGGEPSIAFRRRHYQLEGPGLAPVVGKAKYVSQEGDNPVPTYPWRGPEKPGTFQYVATFTWGKRGEEIRLPGLPKWDTYVGTPTNSGGTYSVAPSNTTANSRVREPRYESAPSPESAEVSTTYLTVDNPSLGFTAISVRVPNIEYALGFQTQHPSGSPSGARVSQHQSGIWVRIYRKRIATLDDDPNDPYEDMESAALGLTSGGFQDNKSKFYLLAEMRVDELNRGEFIDDGQHIPDRHRPLRDIHGYQQYGLYPRPNAEFTIDVRCLRRPQPLEDDTDVPRIHPEAINTLIHRALAYTYRMTGNEAMYMSLTEQYREDLVALGKRYGDLRPPAVPGYKRPARAGNPYTRRRQRTWYKPS